MNALPLAATEAALFRFDGAATAAVDNGGEPMALDASTLPTAPLAAAPAGGRAPGSGWRLEAFGHEDLPQARELLRACYPGTPVALWDRGFERLRQVPCGAAGQPLGTLLLGPSGPAGLALLMASSRPWPGGRQRHINANSWAIVPAARDRALWMARHGLSELTTTYSVLTPIATVAKLLQRVGFEAVTHQQILASTMRLAMRADRGPSRRAAVLAGADALHALRDDLLAPTLEDHRRLGCTVLALHSEAVGADHPAWVPLVFRSTRRLRCVPTAELVYAPSQALVAEHAPQLAAQLLRRGHLLMAFDAHQDLVPAFPCTRLFQRRYARCLLNPRGVDHLYSELIYLHR